MRNLFIQATHLPTGRTVRITDNSFVKAKKLAIGYLRSLIAYDAPAPKPVRTYELDGPTGAFIRQAGERIAAGDEVARVLDGDLDFIRKRAKP